LEINQGYTTMHSQPIIKKKMNSSEVLQVTDPCHTHWPLH